MLKIPLLELLRAVSWLFVDEAVAASLHCICIFLYLWLLCFLRLCF